MLMPLFDKGTLTNDAYADLNDVRKTCIVQAKDNTLNKPVSGATYYNVLTIRGSHFMSQIAFDVMSSNCYTRSVYIHQGVDEWPWPSWVKITTTAIQ